jgi:phage baseplate assembly protein W
MPVERVSQGFLDLSMTFQYNPINYDLIVLKNETAIARSIRNLISTDREERLFNNELGSNIKDSLFEPIDGITASIIENKISELIQLNEPRVRLNFVSVNQNEQTYELNVTVNYYIVGIEASAQQLSFALQPAR